MFKISNFYLVGAIIISTLMISGCATTSIKDSSEQVAKLKPPEIKFGAFEKIYLRTTDINSALASHPANQGALLKIDQHLFYRLFRIFPSLTGIEANEQLDGLDKNSLLIEPFVDDITFISRVVRIFQSIGCWDSNVNLRVTFTDLSQDKIIASPSFYQRAAANAAQLSFGYHDSTMLTRIGDLASEYILLHIKSEAEHQTYEPIPKSLASSVVDGFFGFLGIALLVADQVPNGEDSVGHPISVFNTTTPSGTYPGGTYPGESSGHWILENIDAGSMMVLEDNSVWEIDPLDKISESTFLWLLTSEITIVTSNSGSPGYDYLLINADDGGKPHAKFLGWKNELN